MKRKIILILSIIIFISLLILIYYKYIKKADNEEKNVNYGDLIEVSYSCSGNMLGNVYNIKLEEKIEIDKNEITGKNNIASLDDGIIDETLFVYDDCSPNLKLEYKTKNGKYSFDYYNISYYYKMSKTKRNVINKVRDELSNLLIDDNVLTTEIISSD